MPTDDERLSAESRALIELYIEEARLRFEATHQATEIWNAYALCRQNGLELPPWILAAFDAIPLRLYDVFWREAYGPPDSRHWAVKLAAVFGFVSTPFKRRVHDWNEIWHLAIRVRVFIDGDGLNETNAIHLVAEHEHISESTVRRAWWQLRNAVRARSIDDQRALIGALNRVKARQRTPSDSDDLS